MRKSRFTEDQMVKILREADKVPVADVAKKHGVSEQTLRLSHNLYRAHPQATACHDPRADQ